MNSCGCSTADPRQRFSSEAISLRLVADGNSALARIRTDRGLGGVGAPIASRLFQQILQFSAKAEYAYGDGMPQSLARFNYHLSPLRLDQLFLGRNKFTHFRIWYQDALSEYVRQVLLDPKTLSRPYIDRRTVELVVNGHLKGNRNYTSEIHQLLTLELIHRLLVDRS